MQDNVPLDMTEINIEVLKLKEVLHNLNRLEIKLKVNSLSICLACINIVHVLVIITICVCGMLELSQLLCTY